MTDYLIHYGVKGMKWGVRHDPDSNGKRPHIKKISNKTKKRIKVGAAIIIGGVASYGLYKTGMLNRSVLSLGKSYVSGLSENIVNDASNSLKSLAKKIRPVDKECNFNSFAAALSNDFNISLKTGAKYEGNVTSLMSNALKNPDSRIFDTIPADRFTNKEKLSATIMRIAKNKDGACGQISSDLSIGGGHAFNWKVENGQVKFFDIHANINGTYQPVEDASRYIDRGLISGKNGKITRLDGLKIDDLNLQYVSTIFDIKPK